MKKDFVEFVECCETRSLVVEEDAFRYTPDRPARWLQRVCIWVLRKLHCHSYQETVAYNHHVLSFDKVFERVLRSKKELLQRNYREPYLLFIGSEDLAELMDSEELRSYFRFDVPYMRGQTFLNMEIHVIPWMKGVLGVPKKS